MVVVTTPRVQLLRLRPEAIVPRYQTSGAAGLDLHACLDQPMTIGAGAVAAVPTGLAMAIPPGFEGQVRPRSGLAAKHAVTVANAPGTVDSDYRGPVMVLLVNLGREAFTIGHGERIAQLVIAPVVQAELEVVDKLDDTERGSGGFGSTGR
jgi:dUTP pyrophosphatase